MTLGASSPLPRPGDVLAGKYRVDRVLGRGAMGVVLEAHHLVLDERVAVKLLLPDAVPQAEGVTRFLREARATAKIKSEHVARVMDVGTLDSGAPFIVMEYLDGIDLDRALNEHRRFAVADAVTYVLQACEAMAEAHAAGIVHRDLKPSNLFLAKRADGSSVIKVIDFGISKALAGGSVSTGESSLTGASVMGSPDYMSPEQVRSTRSVDARADVWSLGVVLFELLTGEAPFRAEDALDMFDAVLNRPPVSLRELIPSAPEALELAILKSLEKEPDARFGNVAELARAIAPFGPEEQAKVTLARVERVIGSRGVKDPFSEPRPSLASNEEALSGRSSQRLSRPSSTEVVDRPADSTAAEPKAAEPEPAQAVVPASVGREGDSPVTEAPDATEVPDATEAPDATKASDATEAPGAPPAKGGSNSMVLVVVAVLIVGGLALAFTMGKP